MNPAPPVTRTEPDNGRLDTLRPGKFGHGHRELAPLRSDSRAASLEGGSLIRLGEREIVRVEDQVDSTLDEHGLQVADGAEHGNAGYTAESLSWVVIEKPDRAIRSPARS